jgi:hypothetical protein
MGTSQSGKGPGPNVPIIPPWVSDTDEPSKNDSDQNAEPDQDGEDDSQNVKNVDAPLIAPPARFSNSRRNLSSFARTGDTGDLKKSVGHYFNKGYGGSKTAARRFAGTARTAVSLYSTLSAVASGQQTDQLDVELLKGRSPKEIIDILVEAVKPVDGTQDSEIARTSLNEALSELLEGNENVDLLNLTEDEKILVIEKYISLDVFGRFDMDLGEIVLKNAPSPTSALSRLKDVKDYIKEVVSSAFRKVYKSGGKLTSSTIGNIIKSALEDAFNVFEEYIT